MSLFDHHVFVCCNEREAGHPRGCCLARGAEAVREAFRREIKAAGLSATVRANKAGCLDQCEHGVTVVVYPEQVWYGFVRAEDVPEIVRSHLLAGRPIDRLRLPVTCVNNAECPHRSGRT